MDHVPYLVIGAGISGLSFANAIRHEADKRVKSAPDVLVLEADPEPGGYCKTVQQDGFVWDYSGHFFHFKHPEIERWLRERMGDQQVRVVNKRSFIDYAGQRIDFPFQKNIHQLPKADLIECLYDLYFASQDARDKSPEVGERSFKDMLYARFGRGICE